MPNRAGNKVIATAPGHVAEVRRLVLDPITSAQANQLVSIGQRILRAIDTDERTVNERNA